MNIVMMTNTYFPILGGLEKSVEVFSKEYRKLGHEVLVVCPEDDDAPKQEKGVHRVPAIQNFNNTDFSVEIPISTDLNKTLKNFKPDIVHAHHPFLIGDTAVRVAGQFGIPIVFTHHTMYEENTHYVPGDTRALKTFVIELSKGYANLCDHIVAPSTSVAKLLKKRGVEPPISVIPTGIYLEKFKKGSGPVFRKFFEIPKDAFLIGFVSRIAKEKNAVFLSKAVAKYLKKNKKAYFVVVGSGPCLDEVQEIFDKEGLADRFISTGVLKGNQLISAYKALDVFAFASHSETQGIVLAEAMAAGAPVVGVDAPGVRDVIEDKKNGRIIDEDNEDDFADALGWVEKQSESKYKSLSREAKKTARDFSVDRCVKKALKVYRQAIETEAQSSDFDSSVWSKAKGVLKAQSELISNYTKATGGAILDLPSEAYDKLSIELERVSKKIFS